MSVVEQKNDLMNELNLLHLMVISPSLEISNFFNNLRTEVDIAFVNKESMVKNEKNKAKLITNWLNFIDTIDKSERECLKNCKKISFQQFIQAIEEIKLELDHLSGDQCDFNAIKVRISEEKSRLEKVLFNRKTILFLNKRESPDISLFDEMDTESTVGILIIITNEYFSNSYVKLLKG